MPASAVIRTPSSTAARPAMPGVPAMKRPMPSTGSYERSMSNWSRWPNQPWIGERRRGWTSSAAYRKAGAPGPPLRYL